MNRTTLKKITTCVVLALAVIALWWIRSRRDDGYSRPPPVFGDTHRLESTPEIEPNPGKDADAENIDELPRPPGYSRSDWAKQKEVHQRMLSWNGPVEFHAKLVDQHFQPVAGAKVEIRISSYQKNSLSLIIKGERPDPLERKEIDLFSDANGKIAFTGRKGITLHVLNITKAGYLAGPIERGSFGYGFNAERDALHTNPATPLVFKLWKQGTSEPFIGRHHEVWLMDGQFDRQEGWINLVTGEVKSENGGGPVDLVIRDLDPTEEQRRRRIARVIELEMINGGIQETSDVLPYSAPEAGYVPKVIYEIDERAARSFPGRRRNVYVQLRKGRLYGGIVTSLTSLHVLALDISINPNGSRNLEPDPAKQITDETEIRRLDLETSR